MPKKREEVRMVKLTVTVEEATWLKLRHAAEQERYGLGGRPSVNGLIQRLIDDYLTRKGGK